MTPEQEHEWHEEADRLRLLDKATQRQVIDLIRSPANVAKKDLRHSLERADYLERALKLSKRRKS